MDQHTKELAAYYRRCGNSPERARELAKANSSTYRAPRPRRTVQDLLTANFPAGTEPYVGEASR